MKNKILDVISIAVVVALWTLLFVFAYNNSIAIMFDLKTINIINGMNFLTVIVLMSSIIMNAKGK